jgi:hypothetical protein
MTFQDEVEVRRASRGTKVLGFGVAVLAVLGSFWGIVWFIRAYVEAPRVNMPAAIVLASRDSVPVPAPPPRVADTKARDTKAPVTGAPERPTAAPVTTTQASAPSPTASVQASADSSPAGAIADRWFSGNQFGITTNAAPPPPAPPPAVDAQPANTAPAALATTTPDGEQPIEEVAEGSVPAITGPAPWPRRKPMITANVKRTETTPMPRPRPDGPAPQSVWTGVPSSDERFGNQ